MKQLIPDNLQGEELFKYLLKNKHLLITEKKSEIKKADAVTVLSPLHVDKSGNIVKEQSNVPESATEVQATLIINTTNWFDSHKDVHLPGIWKKSLSENKDVLLLQEHTMRFENVISDDVKAFTKNFKWTELGLNIPGVTEALVFDSRIEKSRNEFMFNQYRKGYVKNHSVGMIYVKIELAINSDDEYYKEEFAVWNKYIDQIVNRDQAEASGYFWAVKEAKVVEGSAVVKGSNIMTPTYSISSKSTEQEPPLGTQSQPQKFDLMDAISKTNFFN